MLNPLEGSDEWEVHPKKRGSPLPYLLIGGLLVYGAYRSGGVQGKLNAVFDSFYSKEARALIDKARAQAGAPKTGGMIRHTESSEGTVELSPPAQHTGTRSGRRRAA
ncbi:MAG: hypothetical protein HY925_12150 [Elusimicrobia bacterium]|nr:hypothetical protein [Elusimicrobiota bacterium]